MRDKFLTLLGFARKANKVVSGEEGVKSFLKKGGIKLLLIAEDMPEKRKIFWRETASASGIEFIEICDKLSLGTAIGSSPRAIVGVLDEKMAESLKNIVR